MARTDCFSPDQLHSYLLGKLPEPESLQVLSHLDACSDCEATVAALDRQSDTLLQWLQKPVVQPDPVSAYRLAAKRAVACWSDQSSGAENMSLPKLRDYEILEPIAHGGMGTVYRARHTRLNRQVAVKVLPARWLKDPAVVARFEREMQAVGSLRHPAIVQATDGGEAEGVHFLVMELVDGMDGAALVQLSGPLPIADACEIVRQAAIGMEYVHANGIIHRDLKPSNLMITAAGEVKVLDLGLARIVGEQLAEDELTTVGQLMGTLDFMAPEQLENSHHVDQRTDIFALGATLYKLLTGQTPHASQSREPLLSKLRRIASEPATPIARHRSDLPTDLCELVAQMLSPNREHRPQTMQSVAQSIATWTTNSDLAARVKQASRIREQRPRNPLSPSAASAISQSGLVGAGGQPQAGLVPPRRGRWMAIVASGFLFTAVALGVVITLQLTSGQLVIETSTPDVEVRILKAGQPHRQLTLNQTAQSLRLGAGDYDIEIVSDADGLQIENGRFTLKRGDTWLAKIVHREDGATAAMPRSNEPTYDGRTLDEWISLLRQERSPTQLSEATPAFTKLATGERASNAIAAVLFAFRYHDWDARVLDKSGTSVLLSAGVHEFLDSRDPKLVVDGLAHELDEQGEANLMFILDYLRSRVHFRPHVADTLQTQIERLTKHNSPEVRMNALRALYVADEQVGREHYVTALSDADPMVQLFAASNLIAMKSYQDEVITVLRRLVQSDDLAQRAEAAWILGDLGAEAKPALPELVAIVQDDDDAVTFAPVYKFTSSQALSFVSVKDAAIRALAEIGEVSVVPLLTELWLERELSPPMPKPRAAWSHESSHGSSTSATAKWVADAIEKISGRRPNRRQGSDQITWTADGIVLSQAYALAMRDNRLPEKDLVRIARLLIPLANESDLEKAIESSAVADRIPNASQLETEIELIELLAQHSDPFRVQIAVLSRISIVERVHPSSELRTATMAYLQTAVKVWNLTEPERKPSNALSILDRLGQYSGPVNEIDVTPLSECLSIPDHRTEVQRLVATLPYPTWYSATIGMLRTDLADDETFRVLVDCFVGDATASDKEQRLNLADFFGRLITVLEWQPELSDRLIALIEDPRLDKVYSKGVDSDGKQVDFSLRAVSLNELKEHPEGLRERFVPMLRRLAESGTVAEVHTARAVLKAWKL